MSLKKSVIAVILQNLIGFVVGLGNSVLSTRVLGPEGKGMFAIYTSSVELFALILGFGIPSALLYFAAKNEFGKKKLFVTSFLFLILVTILFWLIVKSSFAFGVDNFFLPAPFNGSWFIFTLVGYFFCLSGWYLLVSILNGHRLFVQTNLISIVSISLTFILYGTLYYLINIAGRTFDVTVFYWIQLLVAAIVLVLCLLFYFRKVATPEPQGLGILNTAQVTTIVGYGLLYFASNGMIFLNAKLDYWFVNYLAGKSELGIYVLASNVGLLLILLPNALGLVLSSYQAAKENGVAEKTAKICRITFSVSILVAIFLVLFGRNIIIMLYGVAFEPAGAILNILIIGIIPYCLFTVFRGYYAGGGKLMIIIKATGAGLLVTLSLDLILIAPYGITGAAIASASSYLVSAIWLINDFCKREGKPINNVLFITKNDFSDLRRTILLMIRS